MINVGVDIVKVSRIENIYNKYSNKFLDRFFTISEKEYILKKDKIETLAGMFACKEAVSKALGVGIGKKLAFKDIEILHNISGKPEVSISSIVLENLNMKESSFDISISHDGDYAVAFVIKY